jgi:hypothetical protein
VPIGKMRPRTSEISGELVRSLYLSAAACAMYQRRRRRDVLVFVNLVLSWLFLERHMWCAQLTCQHTWLTDINDSFPHLKTDKDEFAHVNQIRHALMRMESSAFLPLGLHLAEVTVQNLYRSRCVISSSASVACFS